MNKTVAVIGASGFVGQALTQALREGNVPVREVRAPRILVSSAEALNAWRTHTAAVSDLAEQLANCSTVVNCAGNPDASSRDEEALFGANAGLPGVAAHAAYRANAQRFVHVSSAVVQGATPRLDASLTTQAHSKYATSKVYGEQAVRLATSPPSTVVYRPPSVHSPARRVTRGIRRLATSPFSSVVGSGRAPTPQAHIQNVAAALTEISLTQATPPPIVIHPWEGWTTGDLLRFFGSGREPLHIPQQLGPIIRSVLHLCTRSSRLAPNARRVEMLWFGQDQERSWLTEKGWTPPADHIAWQDLIDQIDSASSSATTRRL